MAFEYPSEIASGAGPRISNGDTDERGMSKIAHCQVLHMQQGMGNYWEE